PSGGSLSGLGRLIDLHQAAALHVVNVTVDRDILRHQRMIADARNVLNHASGEVADRVPFDELAVDRARALADVAPTGFAELCGVEAFRQQIAHHLVGERLHAAIGVMDDEPFAGAEQLGGDHERADRVIGRRPPALRITWASPSARPAYLAGSSRASM